MDKPDTEPVDPKKRYRNPTFGLYVWGPLVPATDCRPCLYTLASLQLVQGIILWALPGRVIPIGRAVWKTRAIRTIGVLSGTYVMIGAALEFARLQFPPDPWEQDAAKARYEAKKRGENPSYWFGPTGYRAVSLDEYTKRTRQGLSKANEIGKRVNVAKEVYEKIRENNRELSHKILEDLRKENESNEQTRENKALIELKEEEDKRDEAFDKNNNSLIKKSLSLLETVKKLTFPSRSSTSASSSTEASSSSSASSPTATASPPIKWDAVDQWEKLRIETDIAVRVMPHTRGVHEDNPHSISINLNEEDLEEDNEDK